MNEHGQGAMQNSTEAARWFRKAAEQGYVNGQFNLGKMYFEGLGVKQDHKEAIRWWHKAADQGHAKAKSNLRVNAEVIRKLPHGKVKS
jgi:TPR repeat protein